MGKLRPFIFVGLIACGNNDAKPDAHIVVPDAAPDAKVFMDAPPPMFDFSCTGNSAPTPAANVNIMGTVTEVSVDLQTMMPMFNPLVGATVDACTGNCVGANKLDTDTSVAGGAFTEGPLATGGSPISGYLKMTHTGDRTSLVYPATPIAVDIPNAPVITFTTQTIQLLGLAGICTQDVTKGLMAVRVTDCTGTGISDSAGITLSIKQGGATVGDAPLDVGGLAMGQPAAAGLFLICNVPENATTNVSAMYTTHTLLAHDVASVAGSTTLTEIRPGY